MQKGVVLSVDDDANLQTVIGQYLENDGYTVVTANNAVTALEKVGALSLNVVLLDLVLPDSAGLALIPQIREKCNAAIIVVSGKSDTMEKIVCLEMGADDYLTKPFEMRELSARITAVMRRTEPSNDTRTAATPTAAEKIKFKNGWCLDRTQYQLFNDNNQSAELTTGEFKLLEALVLSSNRALTRQHLFELTRDGDYDVYDRAIDIQIARLRKKLGDDATSPSIKTIRSVGYMFTDSAAA